MVRQCLFALVLAFALIQTVQAEVGPKQEDMYVTTEDIVRDLITPIIDNRMMKEYGEEHFFHWQLQKIVGIVYNDNHSYDVSVKVNIPSRNDNAIENLVKVRVSPSCEREKIHIQNCNHGFNIEIVEFKKLSN